MHDQARPDIIIPDVGPLIQLAQAGALRLLHQVGRRVVIPEMVAHEAMEDRSALGVQDLRDWDRRRPGRGQRRAGIHRDN